MKLFKSIVLTLLSMSLSIAALAATPKTLKLYATPSNTAKVTETASELSNLIIIYKSKDNPEWLKVADTSNGRVGWVQAEKYQKLTTIPSNKTYRYFQYSGPEKLSGKRAEDMMKAMEAEHQRMLQHMNKMMSEFEHDFFRSAPLSLQRGRVGYDDVPSDKPQIVLPDDKKV